MEFFKKLFEKIKNVFFSQKPELKVKAEIRKLETELKEVKPVIYKNGLAHSNLGKVFFVLFNETKVISRILKSTICSEDPAVANHFSEILIRTGYTGENLSKLDSLSYENLKETLANSRNRSLTRDTLQRSLDDSIKVLRTPELQKIEKVLIQLDRLNDICNFRYIDVIHLFSPDFNPNMKEQNPVFMNVDVNLLENHFLDLLFLISNYEITAAQARAIVSLARSQSLNYESEKAQEQIVSSLRKIASVFNHVLTKENLQLYLKVIKQDSELTFKEAPFSSNKLSAFSTRLQRQFITTINRIETELQDEQIQNEISALFSGYNFMELEIYNNDNSEFFINMGFPSFLWITPMRILKSFLEYFFTDDIKALLNDIVVEGFFDNPAYKTEFAQKVFACNESKTHFTAFEDSFKKGAEYDIAIMKSFARECGINPELGKRLTTSIEKLNNDAAKLLQTEASAFNQLYTIMVAVFAEAHKVNATDITNIKMIFNSSRNRDKVEHLENIFDKWANFLEIMKNYVSINSITQK